MIRITQQNSASAAKRYYATADYYSEGQEIIGAWGGKGAARLGLEGMVDQFSFERLCDNLDPRTGKQLTVRTRTERRVGYDFTFSVPKSVSLLYAMTGDQAILEAFRQAVNETMEDMEGEMKTRVRKKSADGDRTTGNMVWAEFIHTTSRPVDGVPDPQLHAHVFVFNTTWDEEEKRWKAGQFGELKRDVPYFQAAFRVRLANMLQDLGFGVERKRDDFEVAGVPKDVLKRFSRRTSIIEEAAAKLGISDPKRKDELGAETREQKGKPLSLDALRMEWDKRLSDKEREVLAVVHRREQTVDRFEHKEGRAVDHAIDHSFVREAVLPERKLATEALKRGLGAVSVEGIAREMAARPLIRSEISGRSMATTKEMVALEAKLVAFARDGRGRARPLGDPKRPCTPEKFNDGQKAAVAHVLGSRDRVMIIRGAAGTGKTTLEQEIGEALAEVGKPVVAMAQSTKARDVLRTEADFTNAETVAMFLKNEKMHESARGGLILVDEASQLGTVDMLKVCEIADAVGARVLLVGDRRQHRSVTAGEPLRLLEDRAGLRAAEVIEVVRQKHHADYKAVAQNLGEGRIGEAFEKLGKLGWIKEVEDADRYQQLAGSYLAAVAEKKKNGQHKSALVVSPTHAEGDRVTAAIRDALKTQEKLGEERVVTAWVSRRLTGAQKSDATEYDLGDLIQFHQNARGYTKGDRLTVGDGMNLPMQHSEHFDVYRPVALPLAAGDRIRITAGGKTRDGKHRLSNGDLFTVQGFNKRGDIIVDHGWAIDRNFGHLTHGYVATSHSSQGDTVDKVFVAISSQSLPATNERTAYVALTRGREQVTLFTDDRKELLEAIGRPDEPISATELAESMPKKPATQDRLMKRVAFVRGLRRLDRENAAQSGTARERDRGLDHAG